VGHLQAATSMSASLLAARGEVRHGNQDLVKGAEAPVRWEEAGTMAARQDDPTCTVVGGGLADGEGERGWRPGAWRTAMGSTRCVPQARPRLLATG
jgi:hypothetical protein